MIYRVLMVPSRKPSTATFNGGVPGIYLSDAPVGGVSLACCDRIVFELFAFDQRHDFPLLVLNDNTVIRFK
jgi:hypothetical protein